MPRENNRSKPYLSLSDNLENLHINDEKTAKLSDFLDSPFEDNDDKLKNYSQVQSFDRLFEHNTEVSSSITAGGDESYLNEDINDEEDI